MAVKKFPPPPVLPKEMGPFGQQLNRWLIEIQNILNAGGQIDPANVEGLVAAYAQLAALAIQVAANTAAIATLQGQVAVLQGQVAANTASIAANTAAITALQARNQVLNGNGVPGAGLGNNGDLYINNTGIAPNVLYAKGGGAWFALC